MEAGVNFHLRVLYSLLFATILVFCCGFGFCVQQIFSLRSLAEDNIVHFDNQPFRNDLNDEIMLNDKMHVTDKLPKNEFKDGLRKNSEKDFLERTGRAAKRTYRRSTSEEIREHCKSLYNFCNVDNQGPPGPAGPKGSKGEMGNTGPRGLKGSKGMDGIPGLRGVEGPKGESGNTGDPGDKGDKGEQGPHGLLGFPGFKGDTGPPGDKGDKGDIGLSGRPGPMGPIGPPGKDGPVGPGGRRGKKGPRGPAGNIGLSGIPGSSGMKGSKGERGDRGMPGYGVNCTCPRGEKGEKGQRGLIGFTGYKGDKGERGLKGSTGHGLRGRTGHKGAKGEKGDVAVFSSIAMQNWKITDNPRATSRPERTPETREKEVTTELATTVVTTLPPPTLKPRKRECVVKQIGTPLFLRQAGPSVGAWMTDSRISDSRSRNKIWITKGNYGSRLREYRSFQNFIQDRVDRTFDLRIFKFFGTNHVIYNGSFYYQWAGRDIIVRFDINAGDVSHAHEFTGAAYNNSKYLYSGSKSYFDIEVDDNGLWVIYAKDSDADGMYVANIDPDTMDVLKSWRIGVPRGTMGNGFISCGILYLIQNTMTTKSAINYAYDLYADKKLDIRNIAFINPFRGNYMVAFKPDNNQMQTRIYGWDNGRQITYQILFH